MIKVAACYIVKGTADEAPLLEQSLKSIKEHVDGIFIDVNAPKGKKPSKKVLAVARKYTDNVRETVWEHNFVKARNDNFASVPKSFTHILWLDTDDTVENPEKIREVAAVMPNQAHGVYIAYDYQHDQYGNVTLSHYVARLVRNDGTFAWKSSFDDAEVTVHETLNPVRMVDSVMNDEFKIVHHADDDRRNASLIRNIELLEGMYERTKDSPDPRILFYLATHYYDAGLLGRTKVLLEQYLQMSGWAEERSQAWAYLGDIFKFSGDTAKARGCYTKALAENPDDPIPYVELGELELENQMWQKAVSWLEMAAAKKPPQTTAVLRPLEGTYRAYKALATAYTNMGGKQLQTARKWLTKAIELRPFDPELQQAREILDGLKDIATQNKAVATLLNALDHDKETGKILPLLDSLPEKLQNSPIVAGTRQMYTTPKEWPDKSLAIYCGSSALGHWGPWSLEEGIGGSEEAVIQLSEEFRKLGWQVTVYATPGLRAGNYKGSEPDLYSDSYVEWRHYWEFNPKDEFDVLVGWRLPALFDTKFKARKQYLWLHDVIDAPELTKERLDNIDKVIFVSQYHADLYDIPADKKFASGNGIDPKAFEAMDGKVKRNPKKVVYMSAHERGQDLLQRIWPDVIKEVPDAEAHCYYGWSGYDHINRDNPERMEWKQQLIEEQKTLKNFTDHGKIGHQDIIKEIFSAGIWAYPTGFPEVYCISGVKAQAGGAWPVYSNHAALKQTVRYGDKLEIDEDKNHIGKWTEDKLQEFKWMLITRLKDPVSNEQRKQAMDWARNNMSWASTAVQWSEEFDAD